MRGQPVQRYMAYRSTGFDTVTEVLPWVSRMVVSRYLTPWGTPLFGWWI